MKRSLLLFLLFVNLFTKAQILTNAQVYDFMPGDVFQWTHTEINDVGFSCYLPTTPTYHSDSVISRSFSAMGDTVFYTFYSTAHTPIQCIPSDPPYYASGVNSKFYTDLSSPAVHFSDFSCSPSTEEYNNSSYCGRIMWQSHSNGSSCFEFPDWSSTFIEGCGGPYINYNRNIAHDFHYTNELTYYKKGSISCGTYHNMPLGLTEHEKEKIILYPNPAQSMVYISGLTASEQYEISDLSGRILRSGTSILTGVNISDLDYGSYFIILYSRKGARITKPFIKHQ
jgi:hypothetical protein